MKKEILGKHIFLEMSGIEFNRLESTEFAENTIRGAVNACGATLLIYNYHKFEPQGLTAFAVLSESHISFHTYPEKNGKLTADCYTCGSCDPLAAINYIVNAYSPESYKIRNFKRG